MKVNAFIAVVVLVMVVTVGYVMVKDTGPRQLSTVRTGCPAAGGHIPPVGMLDRLSAKEVITSYRDFGSNIEVLCSRMFRMGKMEDGGWEVCDDQHVRPQTNCLVYSFGINNDFSFDDMIGQFYGCEVHAFDPSMNMQDTKRSDKVMFHNLGVSGSNGVIKDNWPVKTLTEIKKMLGHTNRRIDVLKMDIEESEWPTLRTALEDGSLKHVSQFLLEIHNYNDTKEAAVPKLRTLQRLREHGFRTFHAHKNVVCSLGAQQTDIPQRTSCHELHMLYLPACDIISNARSDK